MTLKPALVLAMVCCAAVDPADDAAFRGEQAVDQVHAPVAAEALVGTAAAELAPVRGSLDDKAALDKALDAATAWLDDHASPAPPKDESDAQRKALEEVANPILQKAYQSSQSEGTGGGDTSPPDDDLDDFDDDDL